MQVSPSLKQSLSALSAKNRAVKLLAILASRPWSGGLLVTGPGQHRWMQSLGAAGRFSCLTSLMNFGWLGKGIVVFIIGIVEDRDVPPIFRDAFAHEGPHLPSDEHAAIPIIRVFSPITHEASMVWLFVFD